MKNRLELKKLILKGIKKDYSVNFGPGLNIIEGKISTGKTAIFGFIDYCLGAGSHPIHPEIQKNVRSVQLEIKIKETSYVIERPVFSSDSKINLHECSINEMGDPHNVTILSSRHIKDQPSLSTFLLHKMNFFDIALKESLLKENSDTATLSFRNIIWFCYLKAERLDNKSLLLENDPVMHNKLRQVFDIIFKIHENEMALLSQQIKNHEENLKEIKGEISKINFFLKERKIPSKEEINNTLLQLNSRESELKEELTEISSTLKGKSSIADHLRSDLEKNDDERRRLQTQKRNHETLLKRLLPLRGQYSEDIKKLQFLQDAKKIFDPLNLVRCSICLGKFEYSESNPRCICGNEIKENISESFDVQKEIRSINSKLNELNSYISDISDDLENVTKSIEQQILDMQMQIDLHIGMDKRAIQKSDIENNLLEKQLQYQKLKSGIVGKDQILKNINERYVEILEYIKFPKLSNAYIDEKLTPYVRGIAYRDIGSLGAMTLVSTAWFLSIFEKAIELDGDHPGFIMVDSPQKDIGIRPSDVDEEYRDTKIVEKMYQHIIEKSKEYGNNAQIIIVDNEPPLFAQEYVIVKYSRNKEKPPYGLIDDETEK
jgi:hypothetical protein